MKLVILLMISFQLFAIGEQRSSIYELESVWTNQDRAQVPFRSLKGKPQLIIMAFTSCSYSCPLIINEVKKIDSTFSKTDREKYGIVFFSIDPSNDTPDQLKKYAAQHRLDLKHWSLLTSHDDSIRELAAVLKFKYRKDENMGYSHSNLITVLDKNGFIQYQEEELNKNRKQVIKSLKQAIKK